jgi:hypothetical protein
MGLGVCWAEADAEYATSDGQPMKRKMTAAEQSAEFKRMARELGTDESPDSFDRVLKRIAPGSPAPMPEPKKKKRARAKK